jgi:addiction module HigA family antidote
MNREQYLENLRPGTMLREDYLGDPEMNLNAYRLATSIGITQTHLSQIINGKRSITPNVALRLGKYFGQSPEFWMNLQRRYDLERARDKFGDAIDRIVPFASARFGT